MARPLQIARRIAANVTRAARYCVARAVLPRREGFWIRLRLAPPLAEFRTSSLPFASESSQSLLDVLETLQAAARDPQVHGVLLWLAGAPRGWGRVHAVRRAVEEFRASGKPVAAYAETLEAEDLLIASAASRIWLPESGSVFLVGLRAESLFLAGLAGRLDVRPEVIQIGSHKSAAEIFTRESMSPEQREQTEDLLDDLFAELVDGIAGGRDLEPAHVRELIDRGPFPAPVAAEVGLIDGCRYSDELDSALEELSPAPSEDRTGTRRVRLVDAHVYHGLRARDSGWRPLLRDLPRIAYVVASGAIHRGSGLRGIASDRMRELLEGLGREDDVRGVVLRIDSPGGDGLASDLIWRALSRLSREKPVVVSMGDVVASGGYYVAAAADAVFAEPGTVTGSIGVVGGKVNLEGLYRRIGVSKDAVERGARAGLLSDTRGFTPPERAAIRSEMESLYARFVRRVADGRKLSVEEVEKVAKGRVWSGARARTLGLVDALGGPLEAVREVRRRAGLRDDERFLLEIFPRRPRLPSLRALARLLGRDGFS